MGLKNDRWIREQGAAGMITPFVAEKVTQVGGERVLSYGVESYGYTLQLADEWMLIDPTLSPVFLAHHVVDPKDRGSLERVMKPYRAPSIVLPPHGIALARSYEYWRVPESVECVVVGKSTYARASLLVNVTPLEPGWEGQITIELANLAPYSVRVYAFEGIGQVLFWEGDEQAERSYTDAGGRYQGQLGITLPR